MIRISLIDKARIILEILKNSSEAKFIIPGMLALIVLMIIAFTKKNKIFSKVYIWIYLAMILGLMYFFHDTIFSLFDYFVDNVVDDILFPNLAVYFGLLLIINIIVISSVISHKTKTYVKSINVTFFILMQVILYFIIKNIIDNNINVYESLDIYVNQELLTLVDFSTFLFVIWILVLIINRIIMFLIDNRNVNNENIEKNIIVEDKSIEEEFIEYVPIKKIKA